MHKAQHDREIGRPGLRVIVLAAGTGSRLRPHTENLPKAMIPLPDGRSLLGHTLSVLGKDPRIGDIIIVGTSQVITVNVSGDTTVESNEGFTVTLSTPVGGTIATAAAVGTINNDDNGGLTGLSISNVTRTEGNAGTTQFVFTVTLDAATNGPVSVDFATSDGMTTAAREGDDDDDDDDQGGVANRDYAATSGTLHFAGQAGETQTITISVFGDRIVEPDDTFFVKLSNPTNAKLSKSEGVGTIMNDDAGPSIAFYGDFNGDGTSDILWQNQSTGLVGAWIIKNGVNTRWAGMGQVDPTVWKAVGAGDFNADGTSDILWQNQTTGLVGAWIIKNGVFNGWASLGKADPNVWQIVGTGDFNADSTADVLWHNQANGTVGVWKVKKGEFNGWASLGKADPNVWQIVGTGDFNADSTADVLWHNQTNGTVGVWKVKKGEFNGWASLGKADPITMKVLGTGDFNGDKTSDVLLEDLSNGVVNTWLIRNATFNASTKIGQVDPSVWEIVGAGDYNGNRTADLLLQNQSTGAVNAWLITNGTYSSLAGIGQADPTVWKVLGSGLPSSSAALYAARVTETPASDVVSLRQSDLQPIVQESITRWAITGLDASSIAKLTHVEFAIADLNGSLLGKTEGNRVTIDINAAGNGWFVDSTPTLDEEYSVASDKRLRAIDPRAVDRIDLLTVVNHELGHILGFDDLDTLADDLMSGILESGVRETPYKDRVDAAIADA